MYPPVYAVFKCVPHAATDTEGRLVGRSSCEGIDFVFFWGGVGGSGLVGTTGTPSSDEARVSCTGGRDCKDRSYVC